MAKDTEKLIRQLSLISFLMAKRRPVTALEIKRDVEGYSEMNDDAFARRFYADRAELESLGIELSVEKATEGFYESENYSLPPGNFYLPAIKFTDTELAALTTALKMLDGRFAYSEPLRLALQQLTWGRPSPLTSPDADSIRLAVGPETAGRDLSQRLSKIENAIFRRKTIMFSYFTIKRAATDARRVDPYHLLFRGGQFYLIGYAHERGAIRMFRLSRIEGKISYASKAEHDFPPPTEFDPRGFARRSEWQFGDDRRLAKIWVSDRIAWLVERHFPDAGVIRPAGKADAAPGPGVVFETEYSDVAPLLSWVLGLGHRAKVLDPPDLGAEMARRIDLMIERHGDTFKLPATARKKPARPAPAVRSSAKDGDTQIRPERFARLITLAGMLIGATREGGRVSIQQLQDNLKIEREELVEDIQLLNMVNFGAGSYVLYAEVGDGVVEVDPEPYSDSFARPARLLPLEAKALVAAIDLLGEHVADGLLLTARTKIVDALGMDPANGGLHITGPRGDDTRIAATVSRAIADRRLLEIEHYKEDQDEFTLRTIEPYSLMNGREGWYVHSFDRGRGAPRDFRLDRIKSAAALDEEFERRTDMEPDLHGWPATGAVPSSTIARVWIEPGRARWVREEHAASGEFKDGSITIDLPYGGTRWLVDEIFRYGGDAVVLEPAEAREAVRSAAAALRDGRPTAGEAGANRDGGRKLREPAGADRPAGGRKQPRAKAAAR